MHTNACQVHTNAKARSPENNKAITSKCELSIANVAKHTSTYANETITNGLDRITINADKFQKPFRDVDSQNDELSTQARKIIGKIFFSIHFTSMLIFIFVY